MFPIGDEMIDSQFFQLRFIVNVSIRRETLLKEKQREKIKFKFLPKRFFFYQHAIRKFRNSSMKMRKVNKFKEVEQPDQEIWKIEFLIKVLLKDLPVFFRIFLNLIR